MNRIKETELEDDGAPGASFVQQCVEAATSIPIETSPRTPAKDTSLPYALRHRVPQSVLTSLPIRRRPSKQLSTFKLTPQLKPPASITFSRTPVRDRPTTRSQAKEKGISLSQVGPSQASLSQPPPSPTGPSQPPPSKPRQSQTGPSKPRQSQTGPSKPRRSQAGPSQPPEPGPSPPRTSQAGPSKPRQSPAGPSQPPISEPGPSPPRTSQAGPSKPRQSPAGPSQPPISEPGPSQSPLSRDEIALKRYKRRCAIYLKEGMDIHKTSFRGKHYYVVSLVLNSSGDLGMFHYPAIPYRREYKEHDEKRFEEQIRETGPTEKFGTISIVHDLHLRGIIVDGRRRHSAYQILVREGSLGIGNVRPKTPENFKWYLNHLTFRVFIPDSFDPPTDAEILSLSIALNGDKNEATPLSDADVYIMLQNFMIHMYGPEKRTKSFYLNKTSEVADRAMSSRLLDHLFSRNTRERFAATARTTENRRSGSKLTPEETNRKQVYSRYIRASISFFNQKQAFNLVFNNFGYKCPLWCKELLCYEKFVTMSEAEMTVTLALMGKRFSERRRKGEEDMTIADGRKVVDLIADMLDVVQRVAKDENALKNSEWKHWLGAVLKGHQDKHVASHAYIYSLAFFVFKWNEKTIWKRTLILQEIERDRSQWPSNRRWRGQSFGLNGFDEEFFSRELMIRKQFTSKRKRRSDSTRKTSESTRASKRQRTNKQTPDYQEESDDFYEEGEASEVILPQEKHTTQDGTQQMKIAAPQGPANQQDVDASNKSGQTDGQTVPDTENPNDEMPSEVTPVERNDSLQLADFMKFILNKAGVKDTPEIDVGNLLNADSSQFIDKVIENLQGYRKTPQLDIRVQGTNQGAEEIRDSQRSGPGSESGEDDEEDEQDKEVFEKVKNIWKALRKRGIDSITTVHSLPEPCQGLGLWGKLLPPEDIADIKQMVRAAIFRSRQAPYTIDDAMNQKFLSMFKDMRSMELKYEGFTVCEGFLTSEQPKDWISSFLSYYMKQFTGKGGVGGQREGQQCPWESIVNINAAYDAGPLKKGIGRFQVSSISDVLYLTQNEELLYQKKLKLEVFVGAVISSIVSSTLLPLRFPCFGSKLLVHTADAEAQRLHCDYPVKKNGVLGEAEVKYFSIATGEKSSYLHVLPMGHIEISRHGGRGISKMDAKLIEVPPFSIGIFRGDLPHAGPGAQDDIQQRGKFEFAPRVHFYIDRPKDRKTLVMEPSYLFYPS